MESEPILTPREKSPLPEAQRRIEPAPLHHAGQRAQRTTHQAIPAPGDIWQCGMVTTRVPISSHQSGLAVIWTTASSTPGGHCNHMWACKCDVLHTAKDQMTKTLTPAAPGLQTGTVPGSPRQWPCLCTAAGLWAALSTEMTKLPV